MKRVKSFFIGFLVMIMASSPVIAYGSAFALGLASTMADIALNYYIGTQEQRATALQQLNKYWRNSGSGGRAHAVVISWEELNRLCADLNLNGFPCKLEAINAQDGSPSNRYHIVGTGYVTVPGVIPTTSDNYSIYGQVFHNTNGDGYPFEAYQDNSNADIISAVNNVVSATNNVANQITALSKKLYDPETGNGLLANLSSSLNSMVGSLGNIKTNTDYIDDIYNAVNSNNIWVTNQTAYSDDTTSNPHKYPYLELKWEAVNSMVAEMNSHYLGKPIKALHQDTDNTVAASTWIFAGAYIDSFNVLRIRYELSSGTNGNGYAVTPQHYLIRAFDASNIYVTNTSSVLNSAQTWEIDYALGLSIIDAINNGDGYVYFMGSSSGVFTPSRIAIVGNPYINESRRIQIRGRNTDNTGLSTYTVIMPDLRLPVIKQNPVDSILTAINNLDVSIQQTNFYPTVVNFMTEINANIDSIFDTLDAKFDVSIGSLVDSIDADFDDLIDTIDHTTDAASLIPYVDDLEGYTDNLEELSRNIKQNLSTTINNTQYSVADLLAVADQGISSINNALVWGSGNDAMNISQINKAILDWLDDDSLENDIHIVNLLNTWEDELQYGINNSSQILNLFNTAYSDLLLPPQPGTWANAGSYFTMLYRGDQ